MSHNQNTLTVKAVAALSAPGKYCDGGGLYLLIDRGGSRRWVFLYQMAGKRREMSLGSARVVGLGEARDARDAAKRLVFEGVDPIDARRGAEAEAAVEVPTFGAFAIEVAEGLDVRRDFTRQLWKASVAPKNTPLLTGRRVNEIKTDDVLGTLEPIWKTYPVKAKKLRQKIEHILNVARAKGYMGSLDTPYQNPAQWDGHLKLLLPKRKHKTKHYTALHYSQIGGFMAKLRAREGISARALEFAILTVPRGHEVRMMQVKNLDVEAGLWRVPDEDQKSEHEYLMPLCERAREIVREVLAIQGPNPDPEARVFPCLEKGAGFRRALSDSALRAVIERMGYKGLATPHGFRSTFRDYMGDKSQHPREVIEQCLSHRGLGDETELAYRRSSAFEKRKKALFDWDARCANPEADQVVAFKTRAAA